MSRHFTPRRHQRTYNRKKHTGSPPETKEFVRFNALIPLELKPNNRFGWFNLYLNKEILEDVLRAKLNEKFTCSVDAAIPWAQGNKTFFVCCKDGLLWNRIQSLVYEAIGELYNES